MFFAAIFTDTGLQREALEEAQYALAEHGEGAEEYLRRRFSQRRSRRSKRLFKLAMREVAKQRRSAD